MPASPEADNDGLKYPEWQGPLQEALLEFDKEKLTQRVEAAETAIFNRLQAITYSADSQPERQAIHDALQTLRVIKRDNLELPEREKK